MNLPLPHAVTDSLTLHVGFEMAYECPQPTPMILALNVHYSRSGDLLHPDHLVTIPAVPVTAYRDLFGNWCSRLVAPQGTFVIRTDAMLRDSGRADDVIGEALGETQGNAFRWGYTLSLPVDGSVYEVQFDDWMYLMDERVMLNKAHMSKFGIGLGEVTLSFVKRPA